MNTLSNVWRTYRQWELGSRVQRVLRITWITFGAYMVGSLLFATFSHAQTTEYFGYAEMNCRGDVHLATSIKDLADRGLVTYQHINTPTICRNVPSTASIYVTGFGHAIGWTVGIGALSFVQQSLTALVTTLGGWMGWEMATGSSPAAIYHANVVVPHADIATNDPCIILLSGPSAEHAMLQYAACRQRMSN